MTKTLWDKDGYADDTVTFETWIKHVDALLLKVWGVTTGDVRDRLWHDEFESGTSPVQMVREIVREGANAL
ncbi:hypothetical protein SEA_CHARGERPOWER_92 [Mycobacterium phage Chargerpower]|nr:hypothetical protein SEA_CHARGERPOWER_92 [Mycobacterium phage Chargerpower]